MEELQKLYDALSRDGYYTKSFEEFQIQYQDPAYRDKVFGVVSRDGLYTKSREEFEQKYTPLKKKTIRGYHRTMVHRTYKRLTRLLLRLRLMTQSLKSFKLPIRPLRPQGLCRGFILKG